MPETPEVDPEDPLIGKGVSHYTVMAPIGRGAMGLVYRARHDTLGRDAAIKFLPELFAGDPEYVERFLREARAAATLSHPNIISVYDAGEENGVYYIVMEYVDGNNLRQLLHKCQAFPEKEVIGFGIKASEGLEYAHQKGIVHRDIKPDNLMLTNEGELKIADLGLAKQTHEENSSMTLSGMVMGTPYYISPEQIRGAKDVDARTDIYSLGVTLFHLVTGQVPFQGGSSNEIMSKHLTEPPPLAKKLNAAVSYGLSEVLAKMMAKDLAARYRTMKEIRNDLEGILQGRAPVISLTDGMVAAPRRVDILAPGAGSADLFSAPTILASAPVTGTVVRQAKLPSTPSVPPPEPVQIPPISLPKPEPKPEPAPEPPPEEPHKLKLKVSSTPEVVRYTSMDGTFTSMAGVFKKAIKAALLIALLGGGIYYFPKVRSLLTKPLQLSSIEAVIKKQVSQRLDEASSVPKDFPPRAKACFELALDASGAITKLNAAPVDPAPPPALISLAEEAIRSAAPFVFSATKGEAAVPGGWQGSLDITARITQMSVQRPLNASERNSQKELEKNLERIRQQMQAVEAEIKNIEEAPPKPSEPSDKPAPSSSLIGAFKGDLSQKFEKAGTSKGFDPAREKERFEAHLDALRKQEDQIRNRLAIFESGKVIEDGTKLVFEVETLPATNARSPSPQ